MEQSKNTNNYIHTLYTNSKESANPEYIVVVHIDDSGKIVFVPNGRYNPKTGTVTFNTVHSGSFAVVYNKVNFNDFVKKTHGMARQ